MYILTEKGGKYAYGGEEISGLHAEIEQKLKFGGM